MTFHVNFFNIWALLVCIVINMAMGGLWYSTVFFGKEWMKLIGIKPEDIKREDASKSMMLSIIPAAVSIVVTALLLAIVNASGIADALIIANIVSIGFIAMSSLNLVLFEGRPFRLFLINTGYAFVTINITSVILTLWR